VDISSPNLVNFDFGVQRCHVATCISPSLMHLLFCSSSVSLLVCPLVTTVNSGENGRLDQDASWGNGSGWSKEPHIRWSSFLGDGQCNVTYRENVATAVNRWS